MREPVLNFNGIDGRSGEYLLSLEPSQLAALACGAQLDATVASELKYRHTLSSAAHYGAAEGIDVADLAQTGWGVVFPAAAPDSPEGVAQAAIREALKPLLDLRRAQASRLNERYFKQYDGPRGVRGDESKQRFLARHGAGPGPANPEQVPYYLLLVADPEAISYRFQSQLGVQRAVGRIHFDTVEEYAHYARSVVLAETGGLALPKRAAFFGVANPNDAATEASARHLIAPLADKLGANPRFADWQLDRRLAEQASRAALLDLLSSGNAPALLFTASHGMGFPAGDPLQRRHQGALLCQDWPGPLDWRGPVPEDFYLAGEHLGADVDLLGTLSFLFACYGGGTPALDEFAKQGFKDRAQIAPRAFVGALPQAMLNRPKGGALAVVGHVERAWGYSFMWEGATGRLGSQTEVFESTLRALMDGLPVGAAMEYFDDRYAELASDLSVQLEEIDNGLHVDPYALAGMWTANNDARGYAIFGDPAVRLRVASGASRGRDAVTPERIHAEPHVGPPPPSAPAPADEVAAFGFVEQPGPERTPEAPTEASGIERLVARLGETLSRALDDTASLDVSTWVAEDLGAARFEDGEVVGAELRARTRVSLAGDTVVCLPERDGELDRELWALHTELVRQAQQDRAELITTLAAAAASLAAVRK